MKNLSDKELIDWLSRRAYVEATNRGAEDPNRFEYYGHYERSFRQVLSAHIRRVSESAGSRGAVSSGEES